MAKTMKLDPVNLTFFENAEEFAAKKPEKQRRDYSYAGGFDEYIWMRPDVFNKYCKEHHLSNVDIGVLLGQTKSSFANNISKWKKGMTRVPKKYIQTLAEYFGIDESQLIDEEKNLCEPQKRRGRTKKEKKEPAAKPAAVEIATEYDSRLWWFIPDNAEEVFAKNAKYFIRDKGMIEEEFLKEVGADDGYLDILIRHECKIPLKLAMEIAIKLGMTIEEIVMSEEPGKILKEIEELEMKIELLRDKFGIK